jgi:hypothetical protein
MAIVKKINRTNLLTVVSASILVGTETVGIGLATGWALGGMMGLSATGTLISEIVFGSLGLFALYAFYKKAVQIEPIWE